VPAYVSRLGLSQTEIYVWNLLQTPRTFSWLLENSWLGPAETRKTVLILTCLRLLDFNRQESGYNEVSQPEGLDLEKSLALFNEKANLIQRYITKQLGPVAFNLLENHTGRYRTALILFSSTWKSNQTAVLNRGPC